MLPWLSGQSFCNDARVYRSKGLFHCRQNCSFFVSVLVFVISTSKWWMAQMRSCWYLFHTISFRCFLGFVLFKMCGTYRVTMLSWIINFLQQILHDLLPLTWRHTKQCIFTLWCLINVPPLINFRKIFPPPDLIWTPPLINLGKFLFQQLQNIQKYTVNKG